MARQWVCVVVWLSQAMALPGQNRWNLLELFTLYPQLPGSNHTCLWGWDPQTSECKEGEEGGTSEGDRGSSSSPDPEDDAVWLSWFLRVWWLSFTKLADSGLIWCGALCASVGITARWSYWLAVAIVGIFILQLLFWTITWVICPFLRHATALYRYLRGHGGWHEVTTLQGTPVFRPKWVGPRGQNPWSAEFVQQEVRGRGENRDPFDLLVTDGVAITRLRHGTLRGRTNRNGYRLHGAQSMQHHTGTFGIRLNPMGWRFICARPTPVDHKKMTACTSLPVLQCLGRSSWIYKRKQGEVLWEDALWLRGLSAAGAHPSPPFGGF